MKLINILTRISNKGSFSQTNTFPTVNRIIRRVYSNCQRYNYFRFVLPDIHLYFSRRMGADQSTAKLALSECRIVVVGPRNGDNCMLELAKLPIEARILATGSSLEELQQDGNLFTEVI